MANISSASVDKKIEHLESLMLDFLKLESFSLSWKVLNVVLPKRSYLHRMGTLELHFLQLQIEYSQLKFPTPQFPNYTFELPVKF